MNYNQYCNFSSVLCGVLKYTMELPKKSDTEKRALTNIEKEAITKAKFNINGGVTELQAIELIGHTKYYNDKNSICSSR